MQKIGQVTGAAGFSPWEVRGNRGRRLLFQRCEIGDEVLTILFVLQARENHSRVWNHFSRIGQIDVELLLVPDFVGRLHRRRIGEILKTCGMSADDAVKAGPNFIHGVRRVTQRTFLEHRLTGPNILSLSKCRCGRQEYRKSPWQFH